MESLEELLTCKICMDKYDDKEKKPLFVPCGHTFCSKCLKFIYKKPNLSCPLDKKMHKFEAFSIIPTNFSVLNCMHNQLESEKTVIKSEKRCEKHNKEAIKFFCITHEALICQECLLTEHLGGGGHEIISSENMIQAELLKGDTQKCLEKINDHIAQLSEYHDSLKQRFSSKKDSIVESVKELKEEIDNQLEQFMINYEDLLKAEKSKVDNEMENLQHLENMLKSLHQKIDDKTLQEDDKLQMQKLIREVGDYQHDMVDSDKMEIDDIIYVPQHLTKHLHVDIQREPSPQLKNLLTSYKDRGIISESVYSIMVKVDRKNFLNSHSDDGYHSAYSDMPKPIGWGTTISAPHMHALTLEKLKDYLKPGTKALDIGTGSGYIAACFAEMIGKEGKVYMIDHIQEIIDFAVNNIKKGNAHLMRQKRIVTLNCDGRKGVPQFGPYDVIHVGGALEEVPQELLDQLKPGGRMWIPVGPREAQAICIITKDGEGELSTERVMDVRYGSLTTVEDQLNERFF